MEKSLITLKLMLDELDVDSDIDTIDDRKRVQKAIYLGQLSGFDLGYRFGWYLMGPYCPSLTSDYYALASSIESGDVEYKEFKLKKELKECLKKAIDLLKKPMKFNLDLESWLELVASYHFLIKISKLPESDACETIKKKKSNLFPYISLAEEALKKAGLI